MRTNPNAKHALPVLLASVFLFCITAAIRAQDAAEPSFTLKQIGPNAWAAIGRPQGQSNAGFVIGEDGVAIIDTPVTADSNGNLSDETAVKLLAEIRKLTALPVKFAINTHYHLDHVGGNRTFAAAGAVVAAQRNVRTWIRTENLKFFGKDIKPEQKTFTERLGLPTLVYDQAVDLYLGSRWIEVRSFPGHTGGDSIVLVPDAKIAFTGDLFWRNTSPNLIDASTKPWIDTLEAIAKEFGAYTFVPGHGDVGNVEDVGSFRDYLVTLRKLVGDAQAQGKSGDKVVQAVMPSMTEKFGRWDFFQYM